MNILFRTDSSNKIGSGHILRCITLAKSFRDQKHHVSFISKNLDGNLNSLIVNNNFKLYDLNHKAFNEINDAEECIQIINEYQLNFDIIIIDHYQISENWENKLKPYSNHLVLFQDYPNLKHDVDYVIDQNLSANFASYQKHHKDNTHFLLGTKYSILRTEFYHVEPKFSEKCINILINFGSFDNTQSSIKVIESLKNFKDFNDLKITALTAKDKTLFQLLTHEYQNLKNITILKFSENMKELLLNSDLVFGAGGSSTLERLICGVPSIIISTAENQNLISEKLSHLNLIKYLGPTEKLNGQDILKCFTILYENPLMRKNMITQGYEHIDPYGSIRIVNQLTHKKIVLLAPSDSLLIKFLQNQDVQLFHFENKITLETLKPIQADLIISFGYRHILKEDIINFYKNKIINLHISLLPWNRGADPNLWSFIENTPKGVTIHYIDKGIDTGDILFQKETKFSEHETLASSYQILQEKIIQLFIKNWPQICCLNFTPKPQVHKGTYHNSKDKNKLFKNLKDGWNTKVSDLKNYV